MNLGEILLARIANQQVLRKRPRDPPSSPASSSSGAERPQKRGRHVQFLPVGPAADRGLPPALALDLGPEEEEEEGEAEPASQAAAAAPAQARQRHEDDGEFVPLDQASRVARKALIKRLLADEANEHTCFFCDFVQRYDQEKRRVGGQKEVMLEGAYAYKLAIDYFQQNPNFSIVKKARGILDIYKVHVYDKAVRALGGEKPAHLPEPSLEAMVDHLLNFNYDQVSLTMEQLETARSTVQMFKSQAVVEGRANAINARTIIMANQQFNQLTKEVAKLREARGIPDGPFVMDPQKVMSFADTRPIEPFRKEAEGLGIGGATATNTAAEAQRITAQRPTFGGMAEGEGDDDGDDDEDEDADVDAMEEEGLY
jgi:hypothetical protein